MKLYKLITLSDSQKEEFDFFKKFIFPIVMKWEGGNKLHKVSGDSGGWTLWGVTWNNWYMLFDDFNDFKDTTRDEAALFAFTKFYLPIRADLVPYSTKLYYFDMAYNMGRYRATKIMQRCIGVSPDGIIGKKTKASMHLLDEDCLRYQRNNFYNRLVSRKRWLSKFLKGWLNRSKAIYNHKY